MSEISDNERANIQQEAQGILKRFSSALANIELNKSEKKLKAGGWREEGKGMERDKDFREMMFANAPLHDADAITAEKKKW